MSDFADLKALVASDLRRSDLTSEIEQACLDAIRDHGVERFYFNETRAHPLSLTSGTDEFSIGTSATVQDFIKIDWMRVYSGAQWCRMDRVPSDEMEELHDTVQTGEPYLWTYYGNNVRVFPTPGTTYSSRIAGHVRLIALALDADTNAWTNAGQSLIRYSACKRLYHSPIKAFDKAQAMEVAEKDQLQFLRNETDRRKRSGQARAWY